MDEQAPNEVEVIIGGEVIRLRGTESEEYIQRVGRYIDKKIQALQKEKKSASINSMLRTLLVAVNIADDLFHETDRADIAEKELKRFMDEMGKLQEENYMLKDKLRETQLELTSVRGELAEYVEAFSQQESFSRNVHKIKR
ncbi:MAG: cell division protein ZapA [Clostridiales bacterium]|jgi:cell division protein ZapA|nr:cell division protein ZapA [Clostridiales bacterium]